MDIDDQDLKQILDAFGVSIPAKLNRRAELKHIKTGISVFMQVINVGTFSQSFASPINTRKSA